MVSLDLKFNGILARKIVRATGSPTGSLGRAFTFVVLVDIRWKWPSLPLIFLVFSFVFSVATVIRSTRDRDNIGRPLHSQFYSMAWRMMEGSRCSNGKPLLRSFPAFSEQYGPDTTASLSRQVFYLCGSLAS